MPHKNKKNNKELIQSLLKQLRESRQKLNAAECCCCTKDASQFEFLEEKNFVPIQGKVDAEGNQAYSLLGDCCLNDARKVEDPIRAFTIDERGNPTCVALHNLRNDDEHEHNTITNEENETPESSQNLAVDKETATSDVSEGVTDPYARQREDDVDRNIFVEGKQTPDTYAQTDEEKEPNLLDKLKGKITNKDE